MLDKNKGIANTTIDFIIGPFRKSTLALFIFASVFTSVSSILLILPTPVYALTAQRIFVDFALPLRKHSSADGLMTSLEISQNIPSL